MRRLVFLLLVSLLMAAPTAANVVYNFNGAYFLFDSITNNFTTALGVFSLTTSVPLHATGTTGQTPDQTFVPGPDLTCNGCDDVGFLAHADTRELVTGPPSDAIEFGLTLGSKAYFYFAPGDVATNGVHQAILSGNMGTLTVSGAPNDAVPSDPVPESSSLLFLGSGLAGLAGLAWRRIR